ncbi:hypothetical protein HDU79_000755 [Rhizoclosmatium sp. JEL0117]|nr:hypothetical protein HDU79_000755 [Rhizoclosmatium sp. JEL0117]
MKILNGLGLASALILLLLLRYLLLSLSFHPEKHSLIKTVLQRNAVYPGFWNTSYSYSDKHLAPTLVTHSQVRNLLLNSFSRNVFAASDADLEFRESPKASHFDMSKEAAKSPERFLRKSASYRSVITSNNLNIDIEIHVFAWRRAKSLNRLLTSVRDADYGHRRDIPLIIHLDANYSKEVESIVESFIWRFGEKSVQRNSAPLGLSNMMTTAWSTPSPSSFAIFLEDDISLSPLYFTFAEWCASSLLLHENTPSKSIIGCSLYTPRLNEISPTHDPQHPPSWSPSTLNITTPLFHFQLPCSWGAVYTGKHWTEFTEYIQWRRTQPSFPAVPESRSNTWNNSWKRYLIEFMYLKNLVLVYPNFPNQTSFSTNHYEEGVHSVKDGDVVRVPDFLREDVDERFTVPLLERTDASRIWESLRKVGLNDILRSLPIVDLQHRLAQGENDGNGLDKLAKNSESFRNNVLQRHLPINQL